MDTLTKKLMSSKACGVGGGGDDDEHDLILQVSFIEKIR